MEQNNLEEYLSYIYLQEDVATAIKKLTPDKLKSIGKALGTKNLTNIQKALSFLPRFNINQLRKLAGKQVKGFNSNYNRIIKKVGKKATSKDSSVIATCFAALYGLRDEIKAKGKDVSKVDKILRERENFFTKYSEEIFAGGILSFAAAMVVIVLKVVWPIILFVGITGAVLAVIGVAAYVVTELK